MKIMKKKAKMVGFSTRLEASVARKLKAFAKKNKLTISDITNSSIRVFISEAEQYISEQKEKRATMNYFRIPTTEPKPPGRITRAYGTDDAIKAMKMRNDSSKL